MPAHQVSETFFNDGKMFDGSSISGWKEIHESDMVLMPDLQSAVLDPFTEEPTLLLRCDVLEPNTLQGYKRDPRSIARRAEKYICATGIADSVLFGPEPEFFIFDDVRFANDISGAFIKSTVKKPVGTPEKNTHEGTKVIVLQSKGAIFQCACRFLSRPARNQHGL